MVSLKLITFPKSWPQSKTLYFFFKVRFLLQNAFHSSKEWRETRRHNEIELLIIAKSLRDIKNNGPYKETLSVLPPPPDV